MKNLNYDVSISIYKCLINNKNSKYGNKNPDKQIECFHFKKRLYDLFINNKEKSFHCFKVYIDEKLSSEKHKVNYAPSTI